MGMHRLASLHHRQEQFERRLTTELANANPDREAMRFFETQKARIEGLIQDIEARPADVAPRASIRWEVEDAPERKSA